MAGGGLPRLGPAIGHILNVRNGSKTDISAARCRLILDLAIGTRHGGGGHGRRVHHPRREVADRLGHGTMQFCALPQPVEFSQANQTLSAMRFGFGGHVETPQ